MRFQPITLRDYLLVCVNNSRPTWTSGYSLLSESGLNIGLIIFSDKANEVFKRCSWLNRPKQGTVFGNFTPLKAQYRDSSVAAHAEYLVLLLQY